jgi:6-pyruvoyl-tetrahydropterin synthase related domain
MVLIVQGNSCGHDFDFHLLSWLEVARAWHTGLLYPHWVQDANFGTGEPRLVFYPPASWMLGAFLGTITSWHAAPVLFVLVALLAGGAGMYHLTREWLPVNVSTFAACLYVVNPYALFVAYERGAFGELLASGWLPWMFLFALRTRRSVGMLSLSVAALWLTNSPAAVVGSYLLALLAVTMWSAERKPWPALRAAGGMALGLSLASFYVIPAAFQQRWVQIGRAVMSGMRIQDSFLFAHTANAFHDQVLHSASWIVILEMATAMVASWFAWRTPVGRSVKLTFTAVPPVILFLQFPVSNLVWRLAPQMRFLQFPWRWLMALSVVVCVLTGMAIDSRFRRDRWPPFAAAVLIITMAIGGGLLFFQPCDEEDAVAPQLSAFGVGRGVPGTDEYTPAGVDNTDVQQQLPLLRVVRAADDDAADGTAGDNPEWHPGATGTLAADVVTKPVNAEHWTLRVTAPVAGFAVLRLMDYPSWRVTVDGIPSVTRPFRNDGLMTVPLQGGPHLIDVRWQATRDVIWGRVVSVCALLTLAVVFAFERQREHARPV